jgi:membrane associated rhomboid family serine protease
VGIQSEGSLETNEQLAKWGYYSYHAILDGKFWGLISSNFFHIDAMHLLFNLVWLLLLGSKIE